MMKLTILILMLAGVFVAAHESLRGDHRELFVARRLVCTGDQSCLNHGKCQDGECKCKDGYVGETCATEQCGDVESCGKHGKCRHNDCDCDEGWKGDACDDEIEYEVKLVVAKIDTKTRSNAGCETDLDDFFGELDDKDNSDKLKLATVTVVPVPTKCGDGKSLQERLIIDDRRRRQLKGKKDDDKEAILIGVVLVNSSTRGVSNEACLQTMEEEANRIQDHLKPKQLKDLDGTVVYIEASDACDPKRISKPN